MNRITRLVIEREVLAMVRRKAFWVLTAALFLLSVGAAVIPSLIADDGPDERSIGLVGDVPEALVDAAVTRLSAFDIDLAPEPVASADEAHRRVEDDDLTLALVWDEVPTVVRVSGESETLVQVLQETLRRYQADQIFAGAGVDDDIVQSARAVSGAEIEELDPQRNDRKASAFLLTVILYMFIMMLASMVATSVAAEKANRVSEVLIAVSPPKHLLYGKVIAAVLIGFITLLAGIAPIAVKTLTSGDALPDQLGSTLIATIPWFVGGAAFYLLVAAALGATVERTEEVGSAITPLTITLIAIYTLSFATLDTAVGAVLAVVPISSPIFLPARLAAGETSTVEVWLSLVVLGISVVLMTRLAAAIYGRAIVRTGKRLKLTDLRN